MSRPLRVLATQLYFHPDFQDTAALATTYNDGIYYVASWLKAHRPQVSVDVSQMSWGQDPRETDVESYDYILVSALAAHFWSNLEVLEALKRRKAPGAYIVMGGPHATFAPYEALRFADYVILGEGEIPLLELVTTLERGGDLDEVPNLCRLGEQGQLVFNEMVRYGNLDHRLNASLLASAPPLHWAPVSMSRGCPYNCSFCYAIRQLGRRFRTKSVGLIVAELADIKAQTGCGRFYISDFHFTLKKDFCREIADRVYGLGYHFVAMSRIEFADDDDFVLHMRRSGFDEYCIGVESDDPQILDILDKRVDASLQTRRLRRLAELDVGVHSALIFGLDCQDLAHIDATARWCAEARIIHPTFVCLAEYPFQNLLYGSRQDVEDYRILMELPTYQLYSFVGIFPRYMRPSVLQRAMLDAYDTFFEQAYKIETRPQRRMRLKSYQKSVARGRIGTERHIAYLARIEKPFYRADDTLDEDLLREDFERRKGGLRQWLTDSVVRPDTLVNVMAQGQGAGLHADAVTS